MTLRSWSILMVMWLVSLVTVAAIAQPATAPPQSEPVIIAGDNIGFRVDGYKGQSAIGTLVIRVDGRWVEAKFAPQHQVLPLGSR